MKFKIKSVRIDPQSARRAIRGQAPEALRPYAEKIGAVVVSQIGERFANGGDPDAPWAPLWVDNDGAVARVLESGAPRRRRSSDAMIERADRASKRATREYRAGTMSRSKKARVQRQAREMRKRSREAKGEGLPDRFRKGGKPLRDNGTLAASFVSVVETSPEGVTITVGSPVPHARYQHAGIDTTGPNYIPLTQAARGGWNPRLIPGWDYIVLNSVSVPARPIVRMTEQNRDEIVNSLDLARN